MNLVVDYGNTSAKVGIFDHHTLIEKNVFTETSAFQHFLQNFSGEFIILSSVSADANVLISSIKIPRQKIFILDHTLPLPVANCYATPATLGVDRIAAVCGAYQLFPKTNCLVIDAGTCVTYEFIDADAMYRGGSISPGLRMRLQAMHTFTARLPLVEFNHEIDLTGNSTETCLQSGAFYGLLEELNGIIRRYQEKYADLKVILCGGDAPFFENKLKGSIFAIPELVLYGLNSILRHNIRD